MVFNGDIYIYMIINKDKQYYNGIRYGIYHIITTVHDHHGYYGYNINMYSQDVITMVIDYQKHKEMILCINTN